MFRPAGQQLNSPQLPVTLSVSCPGSVFIDYKNHLIMVTGIILDDTAAGMILLVYLSIFSLV